MSSSQTVAEYGPYAGFLGGEGAVAEEKTGRGVPCTTHACEGRRDRGKNLPWGRAFGHPVFDAIEAPSTVQAFAVPSVPKPFLSTNAVGPDFKGSCHDAWWDLFGTLQILLHPVVYVVTVNLLVPPFGLP